MTDTSFIDVTARLSLARTETQFSEALDALRILCDMDAARACGDTVADIVRFRINEEVQS